MLRSLGPVTIEIVSCPGAFSHSSMKNDERHEFLDAEVLNNFRSHVCYEILNPLRKILLGNPFQDMPSLTSVIEDSSEYVAHQLVVE